MLFYWFEKGCLSLVFIGLFIIIQVVFHKNEISDGQNKYYNINTTLCGDRWLSGTMTHQREWTQSTGVSCGFHFDHPDKG